VGFVYWAMPVANQFGKDEAHLVTLLLTLARSAARLSGERLKLPSDLAGITTIRYRFDKAEPAASMGPACNELREHIMRLGRNV
jgi:hypothetical protein